MTKDSRDRFTGAAAGYARYRPGYPPALVDWVVAEAGLGPGDPVADVGCGTGISTRLFAERGLDVVGIEPNPDMLGEARAAGGARYLPGEAGATGLEDASVALVVVAQALHWFELEPALAEFARILKPGGSVAALYNLRAESPFMREYDALLRRFSAEYGVLEGWQQALAALEAHPRVECPRRLELAHAQQLDLDGLFGRALSSSYVFRGVSDRDGFTTALSALHARYAQGGIVAFPYRAVALVIRLTRGLGAGERPTP
jgi:SAM-dependent methyltransferase